MIRTMLVLMAITTVGSADNVGQQINDFFTDIGKGIEKGAKEVAYSVNQFVTSYDDLLAAKKIEDQKAIEAYKRGQINDEQLRTALWLDQYQYQQAVDNRVRNQYPGGNTYPDLNGNYWGADNGFNGPYDPRVQNSQYDPMSQGNSYGNPSQMSQSYGRTQMGQGYENSYSNPSQSYGQVQNSQANSYSNSVPENSQLSANNQNTNTMYTQSSGYGRRKFVAKKL